MGIIRVLSRETLISSNTTMDLIETISAIDYNKTTFEVLLTVNLLLFSNPLITNMKIQSLDNLLSNKSLLYTLKLIKRMGINISPTVQILSKILITITIRRKINLFMFSKFILDEKLIEMKKIFNRLFILELPLRSQKKLFFLLKVIAFKYPKLSKKTSLFLMSRYHLAHIDIIYENLYKIRSKKLHNIVDIPLLAAVDSLNPFIPIVGLNNLKYKFSKSKTNILQAIQDINMIIHKIATKKLEAHNQNVSHAALCILATFKNLHLESIINLLPFISNFLILKKIQKLLTHRGLNRFNTRTKFNSKNHQVLKLLTVILPKIKLKFIKTLNHIQCPDEKYFTDANNFITDGHPRLKFLVHYCVPLF